MKCAEMVSDNGYYSSYEQIEELCERIKKLLKENKGKTFLVTIEELENF